MYKFCYAREEIFVIPSHAATYKVGLLEQPNAKIISTRAKWMNLSRLSCCNLTFLCPRISLSEVRRMNATRS